MRNRGHLRPTDPPNPEEMSATLFGRGVMTQVGGRRRAEATDAALTTMRTDLAELRTLPTIVRSLEARLQTADRRTAALEAEVSRLQSRLSALEAAQRTSDAVTPAAATEST